MSLKSLVKKLVPGVAWQNRYVGLATRLIDPFDYLARATKRLSHLPPYSVRVRSNGYSRQFGGRQFQRFGNLLAEQLVQRAGMRADSSVLEIGCGCGRTAFALGEILEHGAYTGMDIEAKSLAACQSNRYLSASGFRFDLIDVRNDEYNPTGRYAANEYRFPYGDASQDVIFLVSVFTHMLTEDVRNYIAEIARMLRPGGACMLTTFLVDHGRRGTAVNFPLQEEEHYFSSREMPEIAVGYRGDFFETAFSQCGDFIVEPPAWGTWRADAPVVPDTAFGQDIVIVRKRAQA